MLFVANAGFPTSSVAAQAAGFGDVDGDGDADLVIANNGANTLLLNDGLGNFRSSPTWEAGSGVTKALALGDVNGDGTLDLILANWIKSTGPASPPPPPLPCSGFNLLHASGSCEGSDQTQNLGVFSTACECAAAAIAAQCTMYMFAAAAPGWGCLCCLAKSMDHAYWSIYSLPDALSPQPQAVTGSTMVQATGKAFGSGSIDCCCTNTGAGTAPRTTASGQHCWENLNDGIYGNTNSWIGRINGDKAGVVLPGVRPIVGIQLARDLGGESSVYGDRAGGVVTVEYSATANSDATPWASSTGWESAGSISGWAANTRNYYHFSVPVVADGLRITVANGGTCVDELEIYAI